MDQESSESPRRTPRRRNKPKKYGDFLDLTKRNSKILEEGSEEDNIFEGESPLKPTVLFDNDDIGGQHIFKFKSRHTKLHLRNKVKAALSNSPRVLRSPKVTPSKKELTPIKQRTTPKKGDEKLIRALFQDDLDGQDMSRHNKSDLQDKVKSALRNSPSVLRSPKMMPSMKALTPSKKRTTPKNSDEKLVRNDLEGQDMSRHNKLDLQDKVKSALRNSPRVLRSPKIMPSMKALTPIKEQTTPKKRTLFHDDMEGQDMSRHNKSNLQDKVKSALRNSPRVLRSPKVTSTSKKVLTPPKQRTTPKKCDEKLVRRIMREIENDSSESDFSGDSSDFIPEEESDSETQSSASASDSDAEEEKPSARASLMVKIKDIKMKPKDSDYFLTPDNYFMMNSSKKITTSDHTLAKLANLSLNEPFQLKNQLNKLNNDCDAISEEHKIKIFELDHSYRQLYYKWLFALNENFNIILYGLGSKRAILQQFQMEHLSNGTPCVVVNGFFPSLTIKSILEHIVVDLLENSHVPSNIGDVVNLIDTQLTEDDVDLYLIIHNIDGIMLRNAKAQAILASISNIKRVRMIASIDHINAPMLWDNSKLSKFKFTWWDVTTFMPYTEETSYENSLLSKPSGVLQLSSLRSVYNSLTANTKEIFDIIIKYQLENHKQPHYQGLPFKDWYSRARDVFRTSSVVHFRTHLTEFLDHKIIKMKTYDGSENYLIPIENGLLQQFLDMQNN